MPRSEKLDLRSASTPTGDVTREADWQRVHDLYGRFAPLIVLPAPAPVAAAIAPEVMFRALLVVTCVAVGEAKSRPASVTSARFAGTGSPVAVSLTTSDSGGSIVITTNRLGDEATELPALYELKDYDEAAAAHRHIHERRNVGKVVLSFD